MADNVIEYKGLDELIQLMRFFPKKLKEISRVGMQASLLVLWENVPSYPPPPTDSTYRRTGTLGRTLGSSAAGGKGGGQPDVYTVKTLGNNDVEGRFGTNLSYAEYVIGDNQSRRMAHWWRLTSIIPKAQPKIIKVWEGIAEAMKAFLNSKSSGAQ